MIVQQLLRAGVVFLERVPRGREEDALQEQESDVHPADAVNGDSIARIGDGRRDEHVRVKLVVAVMDVDQEVVRIDIARQP